MSFNIASYKKIFHIGFIAYIIMTALSVIYYRERTILMDSAFDIFHFLRGSNDGINLSRVSGILPKLPALIFSRLGLPVNVVLMAYSVGYSVYYLVCYCLCGFLLKRYDFALIMLLCNVLFISETFYYIPSELPAGIAFIMLFLAFISGRRFGHLKLWEILIIAVSAVIAACFHPLIFIVLLYCLIFFFLEGTILADIKLLYGGAVIFLLSLVAKYLIIKTQYDTHAMGGLKNFYTCFPNYLNLYSNRLFLNHCINSFLWIPLSVIIILWVYIAKKQWKLLSCFLGSFFGYLALINISYPDKATPTFYIENLYLPLGVFLAMPLVFHVLPAISNKTYQLIGLILIIVSGCTRMSITHNLFTNRLNWERNLIKQYTHQKVLINTNVVHAEILQMLWAAPYELLLLSISDGNEPASIIVDEKLDRLWIKNLNKSLVVNWNIYSYSSLPVKYFPFTDTVTKYNIIK